MRLYEVHIFSHSAVTFVDFVIITMIGCGGWSDKPYLIIHLPLACFEPLLTLQVAENRGLVIIYSELSVDKEVVNSSPKQPSDELNRPTFPSRCRSLLALHVAAAVTLQESA
jgi:hypothetical protein